MDSEMLQFQRQRFLEDDDMGYPGNTPQCSPGHTLLRRLLQNEAALAGAAGGAGRPPSSGTPTQPRTSQGGSAPAGPDGRGDPVDAVSTPGADANAQVGAGTWAFLWRSENQKNDESIFSTDATDYTTLCSYRLRVLVYTMHIFICVYAYL